MKPFVTLLFAAFLLAGCSSSSPGGGADAFYRASLGMLDDVRASLPDIQATASEAAAFYCNDPSDPGLTIEGSEWLRSELDHRSGGIMAIVAWWPRETFHGIVLYCLRGDRQLDEDLKTIAFYNGRNCPVYLIGTTERLEQARRGGAKSAGTIVVPSRTVEGVSTCDLATVVVSWTWISEFVAACTRQGKMPVMFQSIKFVPSGQERITKHTLEPAMPQRRYTKFHDDLAVHPVPAGQLGGEWLTMARKRLTALHDREWAHIRQAAQWAVEAKTSGGTAYFWSTTHTLGRIGHSEHNPTNFTPLPAMPPKAGTSPFDSKGLTPRDFVLGIGYDAIVANEPEKLAWIRSSGSKLALSAANYKPENNVTISGEIFITQPWEFGDADVVVPGYDINIAPTSGLMAAEIYLLICAEINAIETANKTAATRAADKAARKATKDEAAAKKAAMKAETKAAKQLAKDEAAAQKAADKAEKKAAKERERELAKLHGRRKRDYIIPVMLITVKAAAIATAIVLHCVK